MSSNVNLSTALNVLKERFGANFSDAMAVREQHGRDESIFNVSPPDGVVFAKSTLDVQDAVKICAKYGVPIIPYGAGSSLEGHLLAVAGGVSIDLSQMTEIVEIAPQNLTATVQAGVTREALNAALKSDGLFFPIDPGANASIGGMCATRASGTNAVRYQTMRENVLELEVVTPQGEVIKTGTRAKKSSAGYDLTRLFVGSEGTLGIITKATIRIYPLPEAVAAATCVFPSLSSAVNTVIQIIQLGVPIARVELMDARTVGIVSKYANLQLESGHMLVMEFHGSDAGVKEQIETVEMIAGENIQAEGGQMNFKWANKPEERSKLWAARHNAYFASVQSKPNCRSITTDVCVPISSLADCLLASVDEVNAAGIDYTLVGHVGDGNFHFCYLVNPDDEDEVKRAEALSQKVVYRAIELNGTCSGEHGIGLHKIQYLKKETGDGAIDVMRRIKMALDPQNIMNPKKIIEI